MDLSQMKIRDMSERQLEEYWARQELTCNDATKAKKYLKRNVEIFLELMKKYKAGIELDKKENKLFKTYIRHYYIWKYYEQYARPYWEMQRKAESSASLMIQYKNKKISK